MPNGRGTVRKKFEKQKEGLQSSNRASLGSIAVIRKKEGKNVIKEIHRIS
jgi:hypothetical protein